MLPVVLVLIAPLLAGPAADPTLPVAAPGWTVEVVAAAPRITCPSVVTCAPDGRVFLAEDPMDLSAPSAELALGRIVCFHPDGRMTTFAEGLHAVFGMQYLEGRLYVLHNPRFSVFRDEDGEGKDRQDLIEQTNPRPWALDWNDHIPANFKLGMDGFFYVAVGDKGVYGAVGRDGKYLDLFPGGVLRLRPEATELEVFSLGVRNIIDVALNSEDDVFTYDNTDERDWWSRLTHMVEGGTYGYPYDFKPRRPYTLWMMADYGGGAATGTVTYEEDALPPQWRGNLFLADFGRRQVMRLRIEREGGTYRVASREEDLLSGPPEFRPVGIDWSPDGRSLYVCDWNHIDTKERDIRAGRLLKATWSGPSRAAPRPSWYLPAAMGRPSGSKVEDLIAGLRHPARSVRLTAQRRLAEHGAAAVDPLAALLADASAPEAARWHAIWALDAIDRGAAGRRAILGALEDPLPSIRLQAARQLGLRRVEEAAPALETLLASPEPSRAVRFHAATAIGRIGGARAVPALLRSLDEDDVFARYGSFTALKRIGTAREEAWTEIARGLESPSARVREGALFAVREAYEPRVVEALASFIGSEAAAAARAEALPVLAGLEKRLPPWRGEWWGYHPVDVPPPRPTVEWAGTARARSAIAKSLGDADRLVRRAAVRAAAETGDSQAAGELEKAFREEDAEGRAEVLRALKQVGAPSAVGLALSVLDDPRSDRAVLLSAIDLAAGDSRSAAPALRKLLATPGADPDVLARALESIGALRAKEAATEAAALLVHRHAGVRRAAVEAVSQLEARAEAPRLTALLEDPSLEVRRAAVVALGTLRERAALPALLGSFGAEETRLEAAEALARIPDARGLDAYLFGLSSPGAPLREAASAALGAIAAEALPELERRLAAGTLPAQALPELRRLYSRIPSAASSPLLTAPGSELEPAQYLEFAVKSRGDPERGRKLFEDLRGLACVKCHAAGRGAGGDLGPNLSSIGSQKSRAELAESVLFPAKVVRDGYRQEVVVTRSGELLAGIVKGETASELLLQDAGGERRRLPRTSIRERRATALSLMPDGLQAGLSLEQFADLIEYLASLK